MADTGLPLNVPYPEPTDLVRDGAGAIQAVAEALNAPTGAYRYAGTRYFTSSGDFLKADPLGTGDIGLRAIRVTVVGGGGGGNSAATERGFGGAGGGGGAQAFITDIAGLDGTVTVTRGAGGGVNSNGGQSSFGTAVVATGGLRPAPSETGRGGLGTAGDLLAAGGSGAPGSRDGLVDNRLVFGSGGDSAFGLGGGGQGGLSGVALVQQGNDGQGHGGGASGGAGADGGVGANGIVIVDCFI